MLVHLEDVYPLDGSVIANKIVTMDQMKVKIFVVSYFFLNIYDEVFFYYKKILKGSLDFIPSPSPSVKIQIMDEKVCLRFKAKTLLGIVNKLLKKNVC